MPYSLGPLIVIVILFALCKSQEHQMDEERKFLINSRRILDELKHC